MISRSLPTLRYVLRRALATVPVLFLVALVTFLMGALSPSDPVEIMMRQHVRPEAAARVRAEYGLDQPIWAQFGRFAWGAVHGDMGRSFYGGRPVGRMLADAFPATAALAATAMLLAVCLGVPLGVLAALRRNTFLDRAAMAGALAGVALPNFVKIGRASCRERV